MLRPNKTLNQRGLCEHSPGVCRRYATKRVNGLDLCVYHANKFKAIFDEAKRRWDEAGQPESDL